MGVTATITGAREVTVTFTSPIAGRTVRFGYGSSMGQLVEQAGTAADEYLKVLVVSGYVSQFPGVPVMAYPHMDGATYGNTASYQFTV